MGLFLTALILMLWAFGLLILGVVTGASIVAGFNTDGG
jgi:hypothetical protein